MRTTFLLLASLLACSGCDGETNGATGGVTLTITEGAAVYGGCGDAGVWPPPEGGAPRCGPDQDFSLKVTLENGTGEEKLVSVEKVEVWSTVAKKADAASNEADATTKVSKATVSGAAWDGKLKAGQKVAVLYQLQVFYMSSSAATVTYRVTFKIDGKSLTLSSPLTPFSGPPA